MALTEVVFERVHGTGLQFSSIKVNDNLLDFRNNKASATLEVGGAFEIYWRIQGAPGSQLTVKYTAAGVEKTAVESKIPTNRSRHTAFKFITL